MAATAKDVNGLLIEYCTAALNGLLPAAGSGATGPGTAATASRVTYASDGATVPVSYTPNKLETTTRTPVWASGQTFTTSTTTARSSAITGTEVMISTDADSYVNIGTAGAVNATVGAGSLFLAKGGPYTFQITSGQAVAAILSTGTGRITLLPVA